MRRKEEGGGCFSLSGGKERGADSVHDTDSEGSNFHWVSSDEK